MSDETGGQGEALEEGTPPKATKAEILTKAREAKKQKRVEASGNVTLTQDQFQAILNRISELESGPNAKPEIEITTATVGAPRIPGSMVNIGTTQQPDVRKVRWTRADIERTYPTVTFIPIENVTVGPHGVVWELSAGVEVTVPSIVRDFHDTYVANKRTEGNRYRPIGLAEHEALAIRAMEAPGQPVWSRLYRSAGSLFMNNARPESDETKA